MTRRSGREGFTLIEVLVATVLLGIFFASVYGLVEGKLRTRASIEESATPFAVGPVVVERIVEDLRGAFIEPYKDKDAFKGDVESVAGERTTRVDFVTTVRSRSRVKVKDDWVRAAVNETGYRCRRSEDAAGLMALYRREDLGVDEEPLAGGSYYKLCDRVKTFRIDWFAEDPGDPTTDEADGDEAWDAKAKNKLPWGCRVTLVLVGDVPEDDQGRAIEEPEEYTFVDFVAFPSRFDKADKQTP